VAPNNAGTTFFGLGVLNGITPALSEGDLASDMLGLIRRVYAVAGLAATALYILVHVYEVQVALTVSKIGKGAGFLFQRNVTIVTVETERVIRRLVRHVEFLRKVLSKQKRILMSMRIVAGRTVALYYGTVSLCVREYFVPLLFMA
jgi:hypothetical protein